MACRHKYIYIIGVSNFNLELLYIMWQFLVGFSAGMYVGTIYDCGPTVTFITTCLKNNIPKEALPKKKDEK